MSNFVAWHWVAKIFEYFLFCGELDPKIIWLYIYIFLVFLLLKLSLEYEKRLLCIFSLILSFLEHVMFMWAYLLSFANLPILCSHTRLGFKQLCGSTSTYAFERPKFPDLLAYLSFLLSVCARRRYFTSICCDLCLTLIFIKRERTKWCLLHWFFSFSIWICGMH